MAWKVPVVMTADPPPPIYKVTAALPTNSDPADCRLLPFNTLKLTSIIAALFPSDTQHCPSIDLSSRLTRPHPWTSPISRSSFNTLPRPSWPSLPPTDASSRNTVPSQTTPRTASPQDPSPRTTYCTGSASSKVQRVPPSKAASSPLSSSSQRTIPSPRHPCAFSPISGIRMVSRALEDPVLGHIAKLYSSQYTLPASSVFPSSTLPATTPTITSTHPSAGLRSSPSRKSSSAS